MKRAQRELYGGGEYHALSKVLAPAASVIVERAGVTAGARVLDVGAGDGNVAIAAARGGATVVATDLSPEQSNVGPLDHGGVPSPSSISVTRPGRGNRSPCTGSRAASSLPPVSTRTSQTPDPSSSFQQP